jgi:hypothetical protein
VFSNGFALSGFEISEVNARLSELYGIPEEKMSERLLAGTPRKIKSFDDERSAKRLVATLTKVGLNCYALQPGSENGFDEVNVEGHYENLTVESIAINDSSENNFSSSDSNNLPLPDSFETDTAAFEKLAETEAESMAISSKPRFKWLLPALLMIGVLAGAIYFASNWST